MEIVEFQKDNHIIVPEKVDNPVEKYLDMDKIIPVKHQEFVHGGKVVEYLDKPLAIDIHSMVPSQHYREVPVEITRTQAVDTRVIDEVIKVERVCEDRIVTAK